jgi:2-dehydropantoate 2-reductase
MMTTQTECEASAMRHLFLGAGGVGGYFGGRLAAAGGDVTFLVRERRAAQLARDGLVIESPFGALRHPAQWTTTARDEVWDVVWLTPKAYDLDAAIAAIAPAVGARTFVLPLLNGLRHIDVLDARFGTESVVPGAAYIAATLTTEGVIRHLNKIHQLGFGPRVPVQRAMLESIRDRFKSAAIDVKLHDDPIQELWDKWARLGPLAAMTCLMRAPVGRIVAAPSGAEAIRACLAEVVAIARAHGKEPSAAMIASCDRSLTEPGSTFSASMLRDIERGGPTEADHVVGDLVARAAKHGVAAPWLSAAWIHLQAYESGRKT